MKKLSAITAIFAILFVSGVYGEEEGFTLKSKDLGGQLTMEQVFDGFGCTGENISPALRWRHVPPDTKSFAVTVYDPDAPTGSGWWHWVIFDIPSHVKGLKRDAGNLEKDLAPAGSVQSITDFGMPGFGGACPPVGDTPHRYIFTVHALDVETLNLTPDTPPAMVGFMLNMHTLSKASLMAYFGR